MANQSLPSPHDFQQHDASILLVQHAQLYSHLVPYVIALCAFAISSLYFFRSKTYDDALPAVNSAFRLGPRWFSQLRWAFTSREILSEAHKRFKGGVYRLNRGDADVVVLPPSLIPELNRLPLQMLNAREYLSHSVLGHLNGLNIVLKTSTHLRVLLGRVSPAIPDLTQETAQRIAAAVTRYFPRQNESWKTITPLEDFTRCVTEGIALALFGRPTCDNPVLIYECYQLATDAFTIVMILRLFPPWLQPILLWLLPAQWRLRRSWKTIESIVVPVVKRRQEEGSNSSLQDVDLLSWLVTDGKSVHITDPRMLARLAASVAVGGVYSTANLAISVVCDLVTHPEILEEVRNEIREKHAEVNGHWDLAAFNSLDKLDSVMKETSRLAPGSLLVYSRKVLGDHTLSNGLSLRKGSFISMSGYSRAMDPTMFPNPETYDGLRHYSNLNDHRARPFSSIDGDILTWGAGRSACPGRFIANAILKILLVKLLDEYEFKFVEGKQPRKLVLHEFVLFNPLDKLMVRKRTHSSGINFK
ncbi:putative cytochrome P450 [Hypomontagnella submonticulosa]|nr:putative cytochrome P450 [Hypomontagnella submonticulosa]